LRINERKKWQSCKGSGSPVGLLELLNLIRQTKLNLLGCFAKIDSTWCPTWQSSGKTKEPEDLQDRAACLPVTVCEP
jgi:hypothetical protein